MGFAQRGAWKWWGDGYVDVSFLGPMGLVHGTAHDGGGGTGFGGGGRVDYLIGG